MEDFIVGYCLVMVLLVPAIIIGLCLMAIYEHIKANGIRRAMTAAKGFDVNSAVAMANLYNIYRQEAREDRRFYKDKIGSDKSIRDIWVL